MNTVKVFIKPLSPFATPMAGDTLFGQLCWAIRERFGVEALSALLKDYTFGNPFVVVSDGLPSLRASDSSWHVWIRKPALPAVYDQTRIGTIKARKLLRNRSWLALHDKHEEFLDWHDSACELPDKTKEQDAVVTQNSINRMTGTTGSAPFSPRQSSLTVFPPTAFRCVVCCVDETRLSLADLRTLFEDIGRFGFGKDATTGMGKYEVCDVVPHDEETSGALVCTTLAPCAPEIQFLQSDCCYYQPVTRFGRHGNQLAQQSAFKSPVMMLASGALLSFKLPVQKTWFGCGLGGVDNPISQSLPETVHQGYAPMIPLSATGLQA